MFKSLKLAAAIAVSLGVASVQAADAWKELGRNATADEVAAWDIDIRPDFQGLKPGSGNAIDGEEVWLEKCALCHGDFGDSNEYFAPLVGGNITQEDIETGRVAALNDPARVRSTLMKINNLSTLMDFINRAMPWNAPKTLTTDELYGVTAYLLSLAYIIEPDFELNQDTVHEVQKLMPNRNGMTTDHGLWKIDGKPDVVSKRCMSNCDSDVKVISSIPDYAKPAHGNLFDQNRLVGPVRGVVYATGEEEKVVEAPKDEAPMDLLAANGCTGCHQVDGKLVGPAFNEIKAKYSGQVNAESYLKGKIKNGGQGVWGSMMMPPMAAVSDADRDAIAAWLAN
jgi:cytochrome c